MSATAQQSLEWFRGIAPEFVAALEPTGNSDGSLSLTWGRFGIDFLALFNPDGSLFMHGEQMTGEWDEWAATIEAPGVIEESKVTEFYMWPGGGSNP